MRVRRATRNLWHTPHGCTTDLPFAPIDVNICRFAHHSNQTHRGKSGELVTLCGRCCDELILERTGRACILHHGPGVNGTSGEDAMNTMPFPEVFCDSCLVLAVKPKGLQARSHHNKSHLTVRIQVSGFVSITVSHRVGRAGGQCIETRTAAALVATCFFMTATYSVVPRWNVALTCSSMSLKASVARGRRW